MMKAITQLLVTGAAIAAALASCSDETEGDGCPFTKESVYVTVWPSANSALSVLNSASVMSYSASRNCRFSATATVRSEPATL